MIVALLFGVAVLSGGPDAPRTTRPVIRSASDLPPRTFTLDAPPSAAFLDPTFLRQTVPALRVETERVLANYEIQDPAVLQRLRLGLAAIAILQDRPAEAQDLLADQRAVETKPQLKAIGFLLGDAVAAGARAPGGERCAVAAARASTLLDRARPEVVREEVLVRYGRIQVASPGYYAGTAVGAVDPAYATRGSINLMQGLQLSIWRMEALSLPPCRAPIAAALATWLNAPRHKAVDIWAVREPSPEVFANATPVTVAIWDSGFDTNLFAARLAIDPAEPLDGKDNDSNGVVDDVHGPTFDYRLMPTPFAFPPLSAFLAPRLGLQLAIDKGERDIGYGLDTPEARFFAQRAREASTAEQGDDVDGSIELEARGHGTSVAGIIARDAPWVRLFNVNALPWDVMPKPAPVSEPEVARWVALMPGIGARMRGADVRVVNMSWGVGGSEFANALLDSGRETDPERARARGQAMYGQIASALRALIEASPNILFVTGAGNSNQSDDILAAVPQTFRLPNLIVAGATATSGRATVFTTFGDTVSLYALGENIPIVVPGGMTMRGQGTSFASPGVAHAAAAMLAVNPALSPTELIEGLTTTATDGEGGLKLLHLAHAVDWAIAHRRSTQR
ncbi:hypothetical protein BH10PSE3_BH10PSE3_37410 [soil metagenome]